MSTMSTSMVILGCGQRKRQTSRPLPAIERYDGPVFRVLRKHAREAPDETAHACVLSARFGLLHAKSRIPRYNRQLLRTDAVAFRQRVDKQLTRALKQIKPERLFVSVGSRYWPLLREPLKRETLPAELVVATGGIGGRASQLLHWLRLNKGPVIGPRLKRSPGEAVLLGKTVRLTRREVLQRARQGLRSDPLGAGRFETWCVAVGRERVAPKWLVSLLFDMPVSRFRTADARRVLSLLGVDCIYASRY
jgi:hypothetical protein